MSTQSFNGLLPSYRLISMTTMIWDKKMWKGKTCWILKWIYTKYGFNHWLEQVRWIHPKVICFSDIFSSTKDIFCETFSSFVLSPPEFLEKLMLLKQLDLTRCELFATCVYLHNNNNQLSWKLFTYIEYFWRFFFQLFLPKCFAYFPC